MRGPWYYEGARWNPNPLDSERWNDLAWCPSQFCSRHKPLEVSQKRIRNLPGTHRIRGWLRNLRCSRGPRKCNRRYRKPSAQTAQHFYVPNIVPRNCFHLTLEQYNAIGSAFASDFGKWLRTCSLKGNVSCSNPHKTLADIITAEKCRTFFERYLNCPSWNPSSIRLHPSDIEKLDVFICALNRYGANVSPDEIEKYLIEDQKWKPIDAAWVRNRIEIGLDVLKVDRRFWSIFFNLPCKTECKKL